MSFALPESMREYIDNRVAAGNYGNTAPAGVAALRVPTATAQIAAACPATALRRSLAAANGR